MLKNWNRGKYLYRLMAFYALICLVPMVVFISFFYRQVIDEAEKNRVASYRRNSEIISGSIQQVNDEISSLANRLKLTSWVKRLRSNSDILFSSIDQVRIQEISNDILLYESMLGFTEQIGIYFPKRDLGITRYGLLNSHYVYQYFPVDLSVDDQKRLNDLLLLADRYHIYNLQSSGISSADKNDLLIVAPLDDLKDTRAILYCFVKGNSLKKKLELEGYKNLKSLEIRYENRILFSLSPTTDAEIYKLKTELNAAGLAIVCQFGFMENASALTISSFSLLFAAIIIAVLLCLVAAMMLARLTYRPVARLMAKIGSGKRGEDFSVIAESFDELNEEKKNLSEQIKQYDTIMHNQLLLSLLHGLFTVDSSVNGKIRIPLSDACSYQVRVFQDADSSLGAEGFANALIKLDTAGIPAELVQNNGNWALIFTEGNDQSLTELFATDLETVDSFCGLPYEGILGISKSFYDLEFMSHLKYFYPIDWELQLIGQIKNGEKTTAIRILDQVREENAKRCLSDTEINMLFRAINNTLMRVSNDLNKAPEAYMDTVRNASISDQWERYDLLIGMLCNGASSANSGKEKLGKEAVQYVNEHYQDEDLSLTKLQDVFGYSQPVISKAFKEYAAMPYYEYLSGLRLDKAKELLTETKYTIRNIAAMVGYTSEATFQRAFKRYTGVTPREYVPEEKSSSVKKQGGD